MASDGKVSDLPDKMGDSKKRFGSASLQGGTPRQATTTAGPVRVYLNHFLVKNMGKNAFFEGKYNFCGKDWESLCFEDVSLLPFPAYIRTTDKVRNFKVGIFSLHEVWAHPPAFLAAVHW
jgi:hypothetical protein